MKKLIFAIVFTLFAFNVINAQCDGKECNINGGEATVMINDLSIDQSTNTVSLRVSNDGPTANFKLKVTITIKKTSSNGTGLWTKEIVVYFNELASGYDYSTFERSFDPEESGRIITSMEITDCEFGEGTICRVTND